MNYAQNRAYAIQRGAVIPTGWRELESHECRSDTDLAWEPWPIGQWRRGYGCTETPLGTGDFYWSITQRPKSPSPSPLRLHEDEGG